MGENKILLVMGSVFVSEELGWFRMMFSVLRLVLEVGLERLKRVFDVLKRS